MRKQTKLVAVLSAAALLALGASMTSFAAGWEKDEAGIWHYYDSDDEMVTGEWKKDGGKWFYLDDDGDMATDQWVDDEYYVGSDGAMYVNQWFYGFSDDDDQDSPDDSGEHWYYFDSKGKRTENKHKKIGGKTYFFNEDGMMRWGWYQEGDKVYYLGTENEGWRAENQWLWLEKSGLNEEEEDGMNMQVLNCDDEEDDPCDEEGWYWFGSDGKMYHGVDKKKINGNWFLFNEHGQMLYEWINGVRVQAKTPKDAHYELDANATEKSATIGQMLWYRENGSDSIDGSRYKGWMQIDGSDSVGTSDDTDWYYFKDGKAKAATDDNWNGLMDGDDQVKVARIKVDGKYFAFNEKGQMQDGLQFIAVSEDGEKAKGQMYYFNSDGYMQTGKVSNVEEDDDDYYNYYFSTKNGGNGRGYTGEKDGYLYWMGKRLEADDDYRIYTFNGKDFYIVNTKGKLQKSSSKKFTIEKIGSSYDEDITLDIGRKSYLILDEDKAYAEKVACVPHIELADNWILPDFTGESSAIIVDKSSEDFIDLETYKELIK